MKSERKEAADALANATRTEQQATAKYAQAVDLAENATRVAKDTAAAAEQLKQLTDLSQLGGKIDAAIAEPGFRQQVVNRVLPTGAVIAFDSPTGCPEGWTIVDKAEGRFLIGAGPNVNLDQAGRRLMSYKGGQTGGEENHLLTLSEILPMTMGSNYCNTRNTFAQTLVTLAQRLWDATPQDRTLSFQQLASQNLLAADNHTIFCRLSSRLFTARRIKARPECHVDLADCETLITRWRNPPPSPRGSPSCRTSRPTYRPRPPAS